MKITVSAGLIIYLLVFQVNVEQLWRVVRQARWGYLLAAMVLMIGGTALRVVCLGRYNYLDGKTGRWR